MPVKSSHNAGRTLTVLELVARLQPVGVSALAREAGVTKSAVQRDLVTLDDAGWIRPAQGGRGQWELSLHMLSLARPPHSVDGLRQRIRPTLEALHAETHETVYLTLPHDGAFVVFDALESPHVRRIVRPIGMPIGIEGTATGKAFLPYLDRDAQVAMLGRAPSVRLQREFAKTRERGFAVNDGDVVPGSVAIAAPILDEAGRPQGAIVIVGPIERVGPERWMALGVRLIAAVRHGDFGLGETEFAAEYTP